MSKIRIATCVPLQNYTVAAKLAWLDKAIAANPCDLFITSQEYFGGGSIRELCRRKGIFTDDFPIEEAALSNAIGTLARLHRTCIGIGATVKRGDVCTEDFLYYSAEGELLGYHSKIALPVQDSVINGGASGVTPEVEPARAAKVIAIPALGLRVGTVFCWQVFFNLFWQDLADQKCNLVAHPIKFAPRAWYEKGVNQNNEPTRIGFKQDRVGKDPASDPLGWIRKLKFESEFKELPIAVSCNTWGGGEQYLALVGFVDETTRHTDLHHVPSAATAEKVVVSEYDPSLYDELAHLSLGVYARFKENWQPLMEGTMRRKAVRIEQRARDGRAKLKLEKHVEKQKAKKASAVQDAAQQQFFAADTAE